MSAELLLRNDMDFRIRGFRDTRVSPVSSSYLNAATTATWEVRTDKYPNGEAIASGTLAYVSGSNGEYVGGPDDSVELEEDVEYWVRVLLAQDGVKGEWEVPAIGARRLGDSPTN